MNNVIVITYDGVKPTQNIVDEINSILNPCIKNGASATFNCIEDEEVPEQIKIYIWGNDKTTLKLQCIKIIKESLHVGLKEAKDMFETGVILVPSNADKKTLFEQLISNGVYPHTEENDDVALEAAAIFINVYYNNPWTMLSEVADARSINPTMRSEKLKALLNAVDIIGGHSTEECAKYGISSIMHNTCYNVKYHIFNID